MMRVMAHTLMAQLRRRESVQLWAMFTLLCVLAYVAIDIALTLLRPDYSSLHNAESDFGRGPYFWLMDINFVLRCVLTLALARALRISFPKNSPVRRVAGWLVVWGVASGLLAFFADNPYGYPRLRSGSVHLLLAFVAFIAVLVAMVWASRLAHMMGLRPVARHSLLVLTVVAILSTLLLGHAHIGPQGLGGLYERIFLASVLAWEAVLANSLQQVHTKKARQATVVPGA
jgi:hypothetical membrane protein